MTLSSYFLGLFILLGTLMVFLVAGYAFLHVTSRWQARAVRPGSRNRSAYRQHSAFPIRLMR